MRFLISILMILIFPILLLIYFVDPAQVRIFNVCPIYASTGFLCPSCGMTRALHNLLHLRFYEAWQYNPLIYVLVSVLAGLVYSYIASIRNARSVFDNKKLTMILVGVALGIIIGFTVFRNISLG